MPMFTHATVGANDIEKARAFYDDVLEPLGYTRTTDLGDGGSIWGERGSVEFFVLKPNDGNAATIGNGVTISFAAPDRAAVDAFHAKALAAGGVCAGEPGPRGWAPNAYAAYARDLDGNKLAAYSFVAE